MSVTFCHLPLGVISNHPIGHLPSLSIKEKLPQYPLDIATIGGVKVAIDNAAGLSDRRSRSMVVEMATGSVAAISKVAISNWHCISLPMLSPQMSNPTP